MNRAFGMSDARTGWGSTGATIGGGPAGNGAMMVGASTGNDGTNGASTGGLSSCMAIWAIVNTVF
jgi:hypothetical protein